METLRLYFQLYYRPILLFLSYFACSPLFLLFHLHSFFVYKEPISVRKKGVVKWEEKRRRKMRTLKKKENIEYTWSSLHALVRFMKFVAPWNQNICTQK